MHTVLKTFLVLFSIFYTSVCLCQDAMPFVSKDSLYREDQFYIGFTYNLLSAVPNGVKVRGLSGGLQLGYIRDMPLNKSRTIAIGIGAGLGYDQFGQNLFIGQDDKQETIFTILTDDIIYDRNRFSMAIIEAPIEFRWRSSSVDNYKFWRIYGGARIGYAYYYKSVFKQANNNLNQNKIPEFDPLRIAATLSFGYNTFNFYANYSINPFFKDAKTNEGLDVGFKTIKVGLIFYIL